MAKPAVDPLVWTPPTNPGLTGPWETNNQLADAELWRVPGHGPEDVVVAPDGTVFTGTDDGSVLALTDGGNTIRRVAATGGRPLGIELLDDDRLLVCDAEKGLLAVTIATGAVEPLVTAVDGQPLQLVNNAAVAPDGTIYFTDSSRKFPLEHYKGDLIEHRGTGRLFRRDPDGTITTLLDGLVFANGVALAPDGSFVLVAETGMYRIVRVWLTGERTGTSDTFAELPGFPDNLSTGPSGTFWCAVASPRNSLLDLLADKPAALRRVVWALPAAVQPSPAPVAFVLGYDGDGTITHNLQSHGAEFRVSTGVREHDGWLYLGSLEGNVVARHRL